jgi:hypothetical protein
MMETIETLGRRLEHALRKYADKIVEAACCNNAQRLRELHEGLCALREVLIEWQLIAEELGVFSTASANGPNGGGGSSAPAPAASFTSEEVSDA